MSYNRKYKGYIMEIKTMSGFSNRNLESTSKIYESDKLTDSRVVDVENLNKVGKYNNEEKDKYIEDEETKENFGNNKTRSFDYDIETEMFKITIKDEKGNIKQYPTEDLLRFKKLIKEGLDSNLIVFKNNPKTD